MPQEKQEKYYLMCERVWLFHVLIAVGGFFGAYTYLLKGNIFCNAQTGNVVLMGMAFGSFDFAEGFYYFVPISAYLLGAIVSEILPNPIKHKLAIRWDTLLILIEMIVVAIIGFIPSSAPVQISQVAINFIASMQYNTFRQAQGMPMATTFVTNHIRQIGIGMAKELHHHKTGDKSHRKKLINHLEMLLFFVLGAFVGTVFCNIMADMAIWITLIPLGIIFALLLHADLTTEKDMVDKKPMGH